jgi:hypothetical protein
MRGDALTRQVFVDDDLIRLGPETAILPKPIYRPRQPIGQEAKI